MATTPSRGWRYWARGEALPYRGPIEATAVDADADVAALYANLAASYRYLARVTFTSSGSFVKASYAGGRLAHIRIQAPGGGSGGCALTGSNQYGAAGGGGGGEYREGWILLADLSASETVTIGAVGAAAPAGNNNGGTGGTTSFGASATLLQALGGAGGTGSALQAGTWFNGAGDGGSGGSTGGSIFNALSIPGGSGGFGMGITAYPIRHNSGGNAFLSGGQRRPSGAGAGGAGVAGIDYGGGAAGAVQSQNQSARAGGAGGAGIVIIDVYV